MQKGGVVWQEEGGNVVGRERSGCRVPADTFQVQVVPIPAHSSEPGVTQPADRKGLVRPRAFAVRAFEINFLHMHAPMHGL